MRRTTLLLLSVTLACAPVRRDLGPQPALGTDFAGRPVYGQRPPPQLADGTSPPLALATQGELGRSLLIAAGVVAAIVVGLAVRLRVHER